MTELQTVLVLAFVFGIPFFFTCIAIAMSGRCAREEREQQMLRSAEVIPFSHRTYGRSSSHKP